MTPRAAGRSSSRRSPARAGVPRAAARARADARRTRSTTRRYPSLTTRARGSCGGVPGGTHEHRPIWTTLDAATLKYPRNRLVEAAGIEPGQDFKRTRCRVRTCGRSRVVLCQVGEPNTVAPTSVRRRCRCASTFGQNNRKARLPTGRSGESLSGCRYGISRGCHVGYATEYVVGGESASNSCSFPVAMSIAKMLKTPDLTRAG
jgi:hypothetical protein